MTLKLLANNNAKSVLSAGISASATVITVGTGEAAAVPMTSALPVRLMPEEMARMAS